MAVGSEAEMNKVEHRRYAGDLFESFCIPFGRSFQVGPFHWHWINLLTLERRMCKQTFIQVCEIAIQVALRRDAFVYLNDMHVVPRQIFLRQDTKHLPWSTAAAHSDN